MNASKLSDYQLYDLLQNSDLQADLRKVIEKELAKRNLSIQQMEAIVSRYNKQFQPGTNESLDFKYKMLLVALPFFVPLHGIIASRFIPAGHKLKTKQYWFYICVGYFIWTVIVILFGRYILLKKQA